MDQLGHLPPQIHNESHSNVNVCPVFYLKASYAILSHLGRSSMDLMCSFLGNNRKHMHVSAKTISSCVMKALGIAKAHMSPSTLHSAEVSAAMAAGVSLVSILQAGD